MTELTNEQIFKEAWLAANDQGMFGGRVKAGLEALRAANRLALPPGEDAMERARDAGMEAIDWDMVANGEGDPAECADIAIRAALTALTTACTAPQAESDHEYLLKARALHQTNSGLPSSTVDEGKIADLLREHRHAYTYTTDQGSKYAGCYCGARPKPLGAAPDDDWLHLHQARAVVEAIGGEIRGE